MTRKRKLIAVVAAIAIVAILATSLSLYFVFRSKGPFSGTVTEEGTNAPVAGVMVTDGRNVVKTDAEGRFTLKGYYDSSFVTVTVPSGYNADAFYIPVDKKTETYDFKLQRLDVDYSGGHSFLQISDTEINEKGVGEWINHVKGLVNELNPAFLIHTGDICYEAGLKKHIEDMNSENMGVPVRYVIGNHDYVKWGKYGEALYESLYGPVWYSFDVANVHYVVTPFQNGADQPSGYDKNDRWKWLANDLANVSPDKKVVMFNHTTPPSPDYVIKYGSKKIDLKEHNLAAWVFGHYHDNYVEDNNGVLNISTARPDSGGIDSSVSGTRQITVNSEGVIKTQMHYYDFDGATDAPENAVWTKDDLAGNALFCDTLVSGNTAFIATSDDDFPRECGVYAINADTGAQKWFFPTENSIKNNVIYKDGKIIAQDAGGRVYCLNAETGAKIWDGKVKLGNAFTTSTGIAVDGDLVFAGCAAEITALSLSDGSVVWNNPRGYGESSPAEFIIAGDKLIVSSHWDALIALDKRTGKQIWEIKDNNDPDPKKHNLRFRSSTPALVDKNTLIVADDIAIMLIDLTKGKITSRSIFNDEKGESLYKFNVSSKPYVKDGTAYIATANKGVVAFDLATKTIKWNAVTEKSLVYTAPYSTGNSATVESSFIEKDGCLVFGANDGYLYKVSMADGSIVKKINVGAPIFGKAALYGENVIFSDFAGRIYSLSI